jgi:cytochrome P450
MLEYNPFSWEAQYFPYPLYRRLRDEAPVYRNEEMGFWALTRHDDVLEAHLDPATFVSGHGITLEGIEMGTPGLLIIKDPPEHTWHRRVVSRVFSPRRVADLEPFIRRIAQELLDPLVGTDGFDVVESFATRLPLDVIGELLGLPAELRPQLHELADRMVSREGTEGTEGTESSGDAVAAQAELMEMLGAVVADRRRHPTDDVTSLMITSDVVDDHGRVSKLDDVDIVAKFLELASAGHETVASLIPSGVVALAWYPDARRALVQDPSLMPNAVEEMLRWDPPSRYQGRWTSRDVELHDTVIPAESRVLLVTGSATHDEREYEEPELFDIHRPIDRLVAFGFGVHHCIGHALARLEIKVAFEEFLRRFPEFSIDDAGVMRKRATNNRTISRLPITFDRPVPRR